MVSYSYKMQVMDTLPIDIPTGSREHLTLLDLQRLVRSTLEGRFVAPLWISAEISELKVNRSGHCYLNLVEKGSGEGAPRAEARAVIWKSAYVRLAESFSIATGDKLRAGISILCRVMVTYHEVYGFSLQILDVDPSFTIGEVERRRRETISRLQSDGIWDMNREVELSTPTLRIAILSSGTAAGYRDFIEELRRSPYRFRTTLFEALMQGDAAEQSIVTALEDIASREQEFDVVAIIRGGGSTSDLALFDSYRLASYVAQFPLPVFAGIGHDKDVSIVDMVAHSSCKTPTAVATLLVELADNQMATLDGYALQLRDTLKTHIATERLRIERGEGELLRAATVLLNDLRYGLNNTEEALTTQLRQRFDREHRRLDSASELIDSYSPANILRLGFAVVRGQRGVVAGSNDTRVGDMIVVELTDGSIEAEVKRIDKL